MKKQILLVVAAAVLSIATVNAQGFQRKTVEERVKETMDKIADFKLDKANSDKADSTFTTFYRAQQKMMEDMMAGGGQVDRDAMRAGRQKLADERDAQLKLIFTDDQYKKWKDEIEPSMRPQRARQ
jgi:periplasmic protein CpxP/Spy